MPIRDVREINVSEQLNAIKEYFEEEQNSDKIAKFVSLKIDAYKGKVSELYEIHKKNYDGKLNRLKKFFSSNKKQDFEGFKLFVTEYLQKFEDLYKHVYDDLKNSDRIKAPDTASKDITREIFLQQRNLEAVDDEIASLEKTIEKNKKEIIKLRKEINDPRVTDANKSAKEADINKKEKENEGTNKEIDNLQKSKKEIMVHIKKLKDQKHIIVSNANEIPKLFSTLVKCLEDCIAQLQKLCNTLNKDSKKSSDNTETKQSKFAFEGTNIDSNALQDQKRKGRLFNFLSDDSKQVVRERKSEKAKTYNAVMRKLSYVRSIYSDNAKKKLENINKLAQAQNCGVSKLSITDSWNEQYSKILQTYELLYKDRLDFLQGTKDLPADFDATYKEACELYNKNKTLCDILKNNEKLDMNGLYVYDNNMGTEVTSGGKFKIPIGYKYWEYVGKGYVNHDNTKVYTMNLQSCAEVAKGSDLRRLYDHDKGSWGSPYWVIVNNSGRIDLAPNTGSAINKSGKNDGARKEAELIIRASSIAGGWLKLDYFS